MIGMIRISQLHIKSLLSVDRLVSKVRCGRVKINERVQTFGLCDDYRLQCCELLFRSFTDPGALVFYRGLSDPEVCSVNYLMIDDGK